ncbi:MAG: hypothetical protein BZY88_11440 [SAR202 cluster bacterium Io17-Chloro-G9]|nr:MAG: hypothetical protein BZY88_11440 [SAR202 cluster bacterium Io17-Chloro-G9]
MEVVLAALLGVGAYLVGSVPSAYIMVRLVSGADLREVGTKNVGALNVFHQLGARAGLLVLALDAAKGALAVAVPLWAGASDWVLFVTAPLLVAGHNWPVFLGFRGGKGAAAILGMSLALLPWLTLSALAPAALAALLLRNVVLGSAFGFVLLNSLLVATGQGPQMVAICILLTVLVTATYLFAIREHVTVSVRSRQWRHLFLGMA